MLKDMIGPQKVKTLEIGCVAYKGYEDKYKIQSLCQSLDNKRHDVYLYPIILGLQGSVFNCFKAAMTALAVQSPRQVALGRMLHDHAVTLLAKIIR